LVSQGRPAPPPAPRLNGGGFFGPPTALGVGFSPMMPKFFSPFCHPSSCFFPSFAPLVRARAPRGPGRVKEASRGPPGKNPVEGRPVGLGPLFEKIANPSLFSPHRAVFDHREIGALKPAPGRPSRASMEPRDSSSGVGPTAPLTITRRGPRSPFVAARVPFQPETALTKKIEHSSRLWGWPRRLPPRGAPGQSSNRGRAPIDPPFPSRHPRLPPPPPRKRSPGEGPHRRKTEN